MQCIQRDCYFWSATRIFLLTACASVTVAVSPPPECKLKIILWPYAAGVQRQTRKIRIFWLLLEYFLSDASGYYSITETRVTKSVHTTRKVFLCSWLCSRLDAAPSGTSTEKCILVFCVVVCNPLLSSLWMIFYVTSWSVWEGSCLLEAFEVAMNLPRRMWWKGQLQGVT